MISKHYTLKDLTRSGTAVRLQITEQFTPSENVVSKLTILCKEVIDKVKDQFPDVSLNSVYRSPRLNAAIGGAGKSDHMTGEAVDLDRGSVEKNKEMMDWIKNNLKYSKLIWEFGGAWVHVSYIAGDLDMILLEAVKINGKTTYKVMV